MFTNVHIKYQKCMLYFYDTKNKTKKKRVTRNVKNNVRLPETEGFFFALLFVL